MINFDNGMLIVKSILYFAGYTFDFENNADQAPLDIDVGRHNTLTAKHRSQKQESIIRLICTIAYQVMIALFILWSVCYGLYMAIRDKNVNLFGRTWFQVLIAGQYYFAISYFKNNHFYENILCNKHLKYCVTIAIPIAAFISLALAIMNVVMLTQNFNFNIYNDIYNVSNTPGKVFLSGLLFFDSLYSYLIFIITACVFAVNMLYHRDVVSKYSTELQQYISQNMNMVRKLNSIAAEYSQMRGTFDNTVKLLTPFFSILNLVGFTTMYFYLNAFSNKTMSITEYINLGLFCITQLVYIVSIQSVNNNIIDIGDSLGSNSLINTFFSGKNYSYTMPIFNTSEGYGVTGYTNSNINDNLYVKRHDYEEDEHPLFVEKDTLESNGPKSHRGVKSSQSIKDSGSNLNLKSHRDLNSSNLKSQEGIKSHSNHNLPSFSKDNEDYNVEYHRYMNNSNIGVDMNVDNEFMNNTEYTEYAEYANTNTDIMLKHIIVASMDMQQKLDWISLKGIVDAKWSTFKVFGVEFTDTVIISKLYGVIIAVLMSAELGSLLHWW